MSQKPQGFLWGASTAAYQIEGAPKAEGKGASIWDTFSHSPGRTIRGQTGDVACEHYKHWRGDVGLIKDLGLNAYRFSISWPRIFPDGRGRVNPKGLDFYSRLIDRLQANGITPLITLYHWDLPQSLQDGGGWLNRRTIDDFADYARVCVGALGDRAKHWITINEPNVAVWCGYIHGTHAPGAKDRATGFQVGHHMTMAHARAVQACRSVRPKALYGVAPNVAQIFPRSNAAADRAEAEKQFQEGPAWDLEPFLLGRYPKAVFERRHRAGEAPLIAPGDLKEMKQPLDFLGLNYYFCRYVGRNAKGKAVEVPARLGKAKNDLGWPDHPAGLKGMLLEVTRRYGRRPLIVTESGMALFNEKPGRDGRVRDARRTRYLQGHVRAMEEARAEGADMRGFCVWSLMDNFEWAEGYKPRFGLTHVDYKTQKRTIKDSALWLREHIRGDRWCDKK